MTSISAYEQTRSRYARLINVMIGYNASTQPRPTLEPELVSLHDHKGDLQVITKNPLTPLGQELFGVLWEIQGEARMNVTFEVAD